MYRGFVLDTESTFFLEVVSVADSRRIWMMSFLIVLGLGFILMVSGCSVLQPESSANHSVENQLTALGKHYSRGNVQRFMRGVHRDYDDGRRNRTDLRYDVSDVSNQYSSLDLTFYGLRTTESEDSINVKTSWNLRWTCTREDSDLGCENAEVDRDASIIVLRRGETTFEFVETEEGFRLISQNGDHLFGSLAPGTVTN